MRQDGFIAVGVVALMGLAFVSTLVAEESNRSASPTIDELPSFTDRYCIQCHSNDEPAGQRALTPLLAEPFATHRQAWERILKKVQTRQMPPADALQPDEAERHRFVTTVARELDSLWIAQPHLGPSPTFRRLTRFEYGCAIRDLFGLKVDAESLLPADETSQGFDNITVTTLPPALLQRYLSAAQAISRQVVGRDGQAADSATYRVRADVTQDAHLPGTPQGTRGGLHVSHYFPRTGVYEAQIHLMRDRNEEIEGLRAPHDLELLLDRKPLERWKIVPPRSSVEQKEVDADLKAQFTASAGSHEVDATFLSHGSSLLETKRQPLHVHFNFYRHPRQGPAVYQLTLTGPLEASGDLDDSPTRRALFVPTVGLETESERFRAVLNRVMKRAYRRPLTDDDLRAPQSVFQKARAEGATFDEALEGALAAVLVSPHFLFRIERPESTASTAPHSVHPIADWQLASRLSFFLWSSLPDETLLNAAEQGELRANQQLEQQVRRMLADPRSRSLVENFGSQWLQLRNLASVTPDMRLYPDFDDNLRQAMRQETELLLESVLREDRSILDLFDSRTTFLNERLADHYGISHIQGSHFRLVRLADESQRGGLLRHSSIQTVTSYATRTSPVLRGKWVLENLFASPPPPPPPNVPALDERVIGANLPVRQRLEQHRADAACAHCHRLIDPVGFCLEHYDAIGRWRDLEEGQPIDARGSLPGAREHAGVRGMELTIGQYPEPFVHAFTEKLLVFALGRPLEDEEMAAVRKIVHDARADSYRLSAIVLGIARSAPFQMRRAE